MNAKCLNTNLGRSTYAPSIEWSVQIVCIGQYIYIYAFIYLYRLTNSPSREITPIGWNLRTITNVQSQTFVVLQCNPSVSRSFQYHDITPLLST